MVDILNSDERRGYLSGDLLMTEKRFLSLMLRAPFLLNGRGYAGVDCWGLVWLAYRDIMGLVLPSYVDVSRETSDYKGIDYSVRMELNTWVKAPPPYVFGDVAVFSLLNKYYFHVGLMLNNTLMMHAYADASCIETIILTYGSQWRKRLAGVYRHV